MARKGTPTELDIMLHDAASRGDVEEVQKLLDKGANMHAFIGTSDDPMSLALKHNHKKVIDVLMGEVNRRTQEEAERARTEMSEKITSSSRLISDLTKRRSSNILLTTGQYSPSPSTATRLLGFSTKGKKISRFLDAWVEPADLEGILSQLRTEMNIRTGSCDAMYATRWKYVWTNDGSPFFLWSRKGLRVKEDGQNLMVFRRFLPSKTIHKSKVDCIQGYLSKSWLKREIRIVLKSRSIVTVAQSAELDVISDPTYDGLDVMCDASWVSNMARALAESLYVRVELSDTDLL